MYVKEEITPKAEGRSKEFESGEKLQRVLRSYRNKSFQSLNFAFVDDSGKNSRTMPSE